ncbi:hypothetical protein T492DRAFT_332553 [Pavlovales sp. CCMP2436]|nr:hypothetical protein T492DRAFT_332553 [Pavlovales sp. CCMP2436]
MLVEPPMFTAKHHTRDAMYVRDISGAWASSTQPFARTRSFALETADVDGARPRVHARELRGCILRTLSTHDIAGACSRPASFSSGRNPLDPTYKLPSVVPRWQEPEWRGLYNASDCVRGAAVGRGQVRETLYATDTPPPLYMGGQPRSQPEKVEGAEAHWRDRRDNARRTGPRRDPMQVADISALRGWRLDPPSLKREALRDPLDPVFFFFFFSSHSACFAVRLSEPCTACRLTLPTPLHKFTGTYTKAYFAVLLFK